MGLGQEILVQDGAARRDLPQRLKIAARDGFLDSEQQVLVLRSPATAERLGPPIELHRIYLVALVEPDEGQGRQVTQEFSQYSLAVVKGNNPPVHHTV